MSDVLINCQDDVIQKINTALGEMAKRSEQGCPEKDYPWIVFSLENTKYAINAGHVLRVAVLCEIIPVKDAPAYCPGIVWSRDGIIRLLDLRALFGLGDYQSSMSSEDDKLPVIVVAEPDGKKRGIIVDEILLMEHFSALIENFTYEDSAHSRYICGAVSDQWFIAPVPVIDPNGFRDLEFEQANAKIDWNGRIDMKLLAEKLRKNGSL